MKQIFTLITLVVVSNIAFGQVQQPVKKKLVAKDTVTRKDSIASVADSIFYRFNPLHNRNPNNTPHVNISGSKANLILAPNSDLSFLFSGSYGDLVKNSTSVNFTQPNATANFTQKLWPRNAKIASRNYDNLIDSDYVDLRNHYITKKANFRFASRELDAQDQAYKKAKMKDWLNNSILAIQTKFDGGTNNNISSLLSGTKPNTKVSGQLGLVWILPGIYHYELADFDSLRIKLKAARDQQNSTVATLLTLLAEFESCDDCKDLIDKGKVKTNTDKIEKDIAAITKIQQAGALKISKIKDKDGVQKAKEQMEKDVKVAADNLGVDKKSFVNYFDGLKCNQCKDAELKFSGVMDSLNNKLSAVAKLNASKSYPSMDKIFDSYKAVRRTFQWLNLSGQIAYNNNIGYTQSSDSSYSTDTMTYVTGGISLSYNLMHASSRAGENVFFGVKGSLIRSDNIQAGSISLKTADSVFHTPSGAEITKSGTNYDAYNNKDLQTTMKLDLNTTLMYFFDKNRIAGVTASSDLIYNLAKGLSLASATSFNLNLGVNFSIPQQTTGQAGGNNASGKGSSSANASKAGSASNSSKAAVIVAPYIGMSDLTHVNNKDTKNNKGQFSFKNHYTFGLNADIPFSLFGM